MNEFEDKLHEDLHQFLLSMKEVDERLRLVSASSLPDGSSHATEAYGLSHDQNVIIEKSGFYGKVKVGNREMSSWGII